MEHYIVHMDCKTYRISPISPWLTEFGPLPWQAKQTLSALCQLSVSLSLPDRRAKFCYGTVIKCACLKRAIPNNLTRTSRWWRFVGWRFSPSASSSSWCCHCAASPTAPSASASNAAGTAWTDSQKASGDDGAAAQTAEPQVCSSFKVFIPQESRSFSILLFALQQLIYQNSNLHALHSWPRPLISN